MHKFVTMKPGCCILPGCFYSMR